LHSFLLTMHLNPPCSLYLMPDLNGKYSSTFSWNIVYKYIMTRDISFLFILFILFLYILFILCFGTFRTIFLLNRRKFPGLVYQVCLYTQGFMVISLYGI
jgi:hypothetical protein